MMCVKTATIKIVFHQNIKQPIKIMEPDIENNFQNPEDINNVSDTSHSSVTKIIIFCVSLVLALALGYFLYSQVINNDAPQIQEDFDESEPTGFDMSTFDENSIESRDALLQYMSHQNKADAEARGETEVADKEEREASMKALWSDNDESSEASAQDEAWVSLQALSESQTE